MIDYGTAKYSIRQAAEASGFALNTLRSLYGRGHFRIVGGEDKKGRGLAADLTLPDIICIAVAKAAVDVGVHPKIAFKAGMEFAYSSSGNRLPSQVFPSGFTVLVCHPATGLNKILATASSLDFAELFHDGFDGRRHTAVVIYVNDIERQVFWALGLHTEAGD